MNRQVLNPACVDQVEHGKPIVPPEQLGKRSERKADGAVAKDWRESECRSVMGRIRVETSPGPKGSRLLHGLSSRDDSLNLF